jgi:diguanylate cyclase (GGDEF)-like protein
MTRDPSARGWATLTLHDRLVLGGGFLLPPAAAFLLPTHLGTAAALLWLVPLLPILLLSYTEGWRGTAIGLALALGLLFLTETLLTGPDRPPSALMGPMVGALLLLGAGIGGMMERIRRDRGDVESLALTDPVTGLPNQRHAQVFLETLFGGAERGRSMAVALFDLDELDAFNRRYGRNAGDEALLEFARFLGAQTRRMNLSARLGREEFVAILADSDDDGARAFADRIREAFAANRLTRSPLTVSAGVAGYHPSMRNPDELLAAADLALHRAKQEGRNRVRVFGRDVGPLGSPPNSATDRRGLDDELPRGTGANARQGYPRRDTEIGRTPPPVDLLPRPALKYGRGRRVLQVMREEEVGGTVAGYLEREGFSVRTEKDATEAIRALGEEFDAVLTDLQGPGLSGRELIQAVKSRWPATQVLVIAEAQNAHGAAEALSAGGDRYLFTPIRMRALQSLMVDLLARRDRMLEARRDRDRLANEGRDGLVGVRLPLVRGLLSVVRAQEVRDPFTAGHGRRVADYSQVLLDHLGDRGRNIDRRRLRLACLVHDIGKVEVPAAILNKTGPLSPEEFDRVRAHPETGRTILTPLLGDELVLAVTGWHHERWDGSGYPDGLSGEAIPQAARIVALTDALDAMTSARAYRSGLAWEDAVRQILDRAGSHFDPTLIEPFNEALPDLRRLFLENPPPPPLSVSGDPRAGHAGGGEPAEGTADVLAD